MHTPRAAARGVVMLIESVDPGRVAEITAFNLYAALGCCTGGIGPTGLPLVPRIGAFVARVMSKPPEPGTLAP